MWLGYAFTLFPGQIDYDTPIYSADKYALPAPVWRCKVFTELVKGRHYLKGCNWQRTEVYNSTLPLMH